MKNRELKFRAYQKDTKFMYEWQPNYGEGLHGIILNELLLAVAVDCGDHQELERQTYHIDYFELMQYTGLKDKTGREIYEGDIISTSESHSSTPIQQVVWDEEWGCIVTTGKREPGKRWEGDTEYSKDVLVRSMTKEIEVIGNIYQNPELLNK